jgi:hypothetical protein
VVRRRYDEQGGVTMQLHTIGIDLGKTVVFLLQRGCQIVTATIKLKPDFNELACKLF